MNSNINALPSFKIDLRYFIKFSVYTLLLVNYGFYILDDWNVAQHTLANGGSFFEWAAAFRTSIDETAWFVLLVIWELETYSLETEDLTPKRIRIMHCIRFFCYTFLIHTVYANFSAAFELANDAPAHITNLCELAGKGISYFNYYDYSLLDSNNCSAAYGGKDLFFIDGGSAITDAASLGLARYMSWLDVVESLAWWGVMFSIELMVRLQDRNIVAGRRMQLLNVIKIIAYALLWVAIGHWIYLGHYVYAWDEFVWIVGFAAIEMNVAEWRKEIVEEGGSPHTPAQYAAEKVTTTS